MSNLPIEAVILMCKTCDWSLRVELDNKGLIQIGDDNIFFLLSIHQDNQDTSREIHVPKGFYKSYHTMPVVCICQECYMQQTGATGQAEIDLAVQTIMDFCDQIIAHHNVFKSRYNDAENRTLEEWLQAIDFAWAQRINEKVFMRTLGHAQFDYPDQRTRLIKQFVAEGKSSIMQSAIDHFSNSQDMQALRDEYSQKVQPCFQQIALLTDSFRKRQRDPVVRAYEHYDKTKPVNLNHHICYEGTLAHPSQVCPEYHIYKPIQYNLNQGEQLLQDHRTIGDSIPKEKTIINAVRKKILQIVGR